MADLLDRTPSEPGASAPAQPETGAGTKLRLVAKLYDHQGLEIGCIAERQPDRAIGLCRRIGDSGDVFDPLTAFLTLGEMQRLALQVAAKNPKAVAHGETPFALAVGFLALIAAVQAGAKQGGVDVSVS